MSDQKRKALIIGASGLIGSHLLASGRDLGWEVYGTYNSYPVEGLHHLSLTNKEALLGILKELRPSVVLVPGAITNVDWAETHEEETFACNVDPIRLIGSWARDEGSLVVFFSTDYVFDGNSGPYAEDDQKSPLSVYGRSKAIAEDILIDSGAEGLIIRTTGVYGREPQGKNFVLRLLKTLDSGGEIKVPRDQIGSPSHALDVARFTWRLIDKKQTGIFNVSGPCLMDRWTFAVLCAQLTGRTIRGIIGVTTEELNQLARRPLKGGLLVHKVTETLGILPQDAISGLSEMLSSGSRVGACERQDKGAREAVLL